MTALMEKLKEFSTEDGEITEKSLRAKIERFMKRHDRVLRHVTGHYTLTEDELEPVIKAFTQNVRDFLEDHKLSYKKIFNMDQTSIFFDMPPSYTVVQRGIKRNKVHVPGHNMKKRVTVLLLVRGDGYKYPPLIVFKAIPDARIARELKEFDDGDAYHTVQKSAWSSSRAME